MNKSRTRDADVGDGLYWASSGLTYNWTDIFVRMSADPISYYYQGKGKRATPVSHSQMVGSETLSSTTFGRPKFNACRHETREVVNKPFMIMSQDFRYSHKYYYQWYWRRNAPYDWAFPETIKGNWSGTDGASRRAWSEMQPRFEGTVSLLNFIFELKDFKDIARHLWNLKLNTLGPRLQSFWAKLQHRSSMGSVSRAKSTLADLTGTAANLRLANEFALKPLISDCIAMAEQLVCLVDEYQRMFQTLGATNSTSHYSEVLDETSAGTSESNNGYPFFWGANTRQLYTATMEFKFDYKLRGKWEAIRKYWGLNLTPGVIWNAIPFSFLLDYFVNVSQAIHSVSRDPNVSLCLAQYCESILTNSTLGIHVKYADNRVKAYHIDKPINAGGMHLVAGTNTELFDRRITMPNKGLALPKLSMPSHGQQLNALALVRSFLS